MKQDLIKYIKDLLEHLKKSELLDTDVSIKTNEKQTEFQLKVKVKNEN